MTVLRRWAVALAVLASAMAAIALAPAPATAASVGAPGSVVVMQGTANQLDGQKPPATGNVYCTSTFTKRCLRVPVVTVTPTCFEGAGRAGFAFNNPNATGAPVDIAVTYGGATYKNSYVAAPGVTSPFSYSGFPNGTTVRIVVGWNYQNLEFANVLFTVACG